MLNRVRDESSKPASADSTVPGRRNLSDLFFVLLGVLTVGYIIRGLITLLAHANDVGAADLHRRWTEQQYFFNGIDLYKAANGLVAEIPGIPVGDAGGYPPWGFAPSSLFLCLNWSLTPIYYAIWQVAFVFVLVYSSLFLIKKSFPALQNSRDLWKPIIALLACSAFCTNLGTGNYALMEMALVAAAFYLTETNNEVMSGALLSVAMIKPTICMPFLLIFLFRRKWVTLVTCGALLAAYFVLAWGVLKVDPLTLMHETVDKANSWADVGTTAAHWVGMVIHTSWSQSSLISAVLFTLVFVRPIYYWSSANPLMAFGLAGVLARLWSYHRTYDDCIAGFLLVTLGCLALVVKDRRVNALFWLTGISLWLPASVQAVLPVTSPLIMLIWLLVAFYASSILKRLQGSE